MAKEEDYDELDDETEFENEDNENDLDVDNLNDSHDFEDDTVPANPMGLAHQISKESEVIKNFKELPREVKYSFFDGEEKREVKHFSRAYRDWKYIEKTIDLRSMEDENIKNSHKEITDITNRDDLFEYIRSINRDYLIRDVEDLSDEDVDKLVKHIKSMQRNYFLDKVENKKDELKMLYDDYNQEHDRPGYIDDMGNIGKIVDTSMTSMGFKGNAAQHSVMTINAVKNEDIQNKAENKTSFSFLDSIKKRLG